MHPSIGLPIEFDHQQNITFQESWAKSKDQILVAKKMKEKKEHEERSRFKQQEKKESGMSKRTMQVHGEESKERNRQLVTVSSIS